MIKGMIFNIQRFCLNDGPGIRTTVFFKGCPLNCAWCHNPESKRIVSELSYNSARCLNCGRCTSVCHTTAHILTEGKHVFQRVKCDNCLMCTKIGCSALEAVGREMHSREVIAEVEKDTEFYKNSGGGITLSGGEPLLQVEFSTDVLRRAFEKGIHTCVETCGFATKEAVQSVLPYTDLFLFDYKETDPHIHKKYTGVDNELILKNLFFVDAYGAKIILRCPIIPGVNDREEHFRGIAALAHRLRNVIEINIEPYHSLGTGKCECLGVENAMVNFRIPADTEIAQWMVRIQSKTTLPVKRA